MSLKQEIETWVKALACYDNNDFEEALKSFKEIADTSKILFNCGVIHATLGEHQRAVECYQNAVKLDQYLAVSYFQQGVSNFLMGDFEEALVNFNDTLLYLRGNNNIDYEQLGLKFKLYSCEVLFNRGLCYIYLQQMGAGMQDLEYASKEKVVDDHSVIDEAIKERAEGYTVFSIPVGLVYRPNEAKVKNLKSKDYLGKARLVAASDRANAFTGFAGVERMKAETLANFGASARDDRPEEKLSYAATYLVKPNLSSRTRQQSEPPINRNMFPPTPPPETDRPVSTKIGSEPTTSAATGSSSAAPMSRAESVRGGGPKPRPIDTKRASFERGDDKLPSRLGTVRSASERPRPRGDHPADPSGRRGSGARAYPRDREPTATSVTSSRARKYSEEIDEEDADELYDIYENTRSPNSMHRRMKSKAQRQQHQRAIEEEVEEELEGEDDYYEDDGFDEDEFEMVSRAKTRRGSHPMRGGSAAAAPLPPRAYSRRASTATAAAAAAAADVRKIRVKVHADDTRFVSVAAAVEFAELVDQIRAKFGLREDFKVMMKDDGDLITMADQDDLEMALETAKEGARWEGSDTGKMEVWIQVVR